MEDHLIFPKMEDNLILFVNERRPQFILRRKTT
jgi:hypothetical protein